MSNASVSFDLVRDELMKDEQFRKEYNKLKSQYDNYTVDENFRGAIYIIKDDEVVCEYAAGYADLPNEIPNTLDTRFASASAGKVFVAVGILLILQGLVQLNRKNRFLKLQIV